MHGLLVAFYALLALFHTPATQYSRMVDQVFASVVRITSHSEDGTTACTGYIIRPQEVLTAKHCVGAGMLADGTAATVLKVDDYYDLALLQTISSKQPLLLRDTPVVRFEALTAVGYAYGWTRLSVLNVHAFLIDVAPTSDFAPGIITQGGYLHGMSGGPIVDSVGAVVGMAQQTNDGIGYGVGVLLMRAFLLGVA